MNLVLLPATDPKDQTCGMMPERIAGYEGVAIHHICFPTMVWYNEPVRREAIEQIDALNISPMVLVGFSKSGLGAWNITRMIPDRIAATIIFDAPVAREKLPPWGTDAYYGSDEDWLKDLPYRHITDFKAALPETHKLVLISGESFHDEMSMLSRVLNDTGTAHVFLSRPHQKHHWQSGWIEEGLNIVLQ